MRPPFDWLSDKRHRRSALRSIERAVRGGWMDRASPEHRAALVAALMALLDRGDLAPREMFRVARVALAMDQVDLAADGADPPPRAPGPKAPA